MHIAFCVKIEPVGAAGSAAEDLRRLFREFFQEEYPEADYRYQFSFRCDAWLTKLDRAIRYYRGNVPDCPEIAYQAWTAGRDRILAAREKHGALIPPGGYRE